MADSKNQRFTSVKLCVIVGSVVTSRATPLSLRTKIVHVQRPHTAREAQYDLLRPRSRGCQHSSAAIVLSYHHLLLLMGDAARFIK